MLLFLTHIINDVCTMSKFLRPYCFLPLKLIQYDILFNKLQIGKNLAFNVGNDFSEENYIFCSSTLKITSGNDIGNAKNDMH